MERANTLRRTCSVDTDPMHGHPPAAADQVTATNFQYPPNSAWGFHHVRELHPTAQVWGGPRAAMPFPEEHQDIAEISFESAGARRVTIGEMLASNYTDGFIVLHRGVILAEVYGNGMRANDPHILMSTTKSFTGSLTGILVSQGGARRAGRCYGYAAGVTRYGLRRRNRPPLARHAGRPRLLLGLRGSRERLRPSRCRRRVAPGDPARWARQPD